MKQKTGQEFKEWFRARRDEAGLTQEAIARRLEVSVSIVVKWENGSSTPSPLARAGIQKSFEDLKIKTRV